MNTPETLPPVSAPEPTIEVGNIVRLNSGGPEMTVIGFRDGHAQCVYFIANHSEAHTVYLPFRAITLIPA